MSVCEANKRRDSSYAPDSHGRLLPPGRENDLPAVETEPGNLPSSAHMRRFFCLALAENDGPGLSQNLPAGKRTRELLIMDHVPTISIMQKYGVASKDRGRVRDEIRRKPAGERAEDWLPALWRNPAKGVQAGEGTIRLKATLEQHQRQQQAQNGRSGAVTGSVDADQGLMEMRVARDNCSSGLYASGGDRAGEKRLEEGRRADAEKSPESDKARQISKRRIQGHDAAAGAFKTDARRQQRKRKEDRGTRYWDEVVRAGFQPRASQLKALELQIRLMRQQRVPKRRFNFVDLSRINEA